MEKYRYLDGAGNCHGPLWLTQIRDLYHSGRLSARTQVCKVGSEDWREMQEFGEIVVSIDQIQNLPSTKSSQTHSVRLVVLVWLLLALVIAWQVLKK